MTSRGDQSKRDEALPDIDWTALPDGVTKSTFAAPSGDLATYQAGDPRHPRVVLVAGVTGSKEDFAFIIPELVRAGFLVQSYDLAGQYESHAAGPENLTPPRSHYDWGLFVEDMLAFLRAGPTPVHLLGYSFAGLVAQLATVRQPELVASLTFLGTPPSPGHAYLRVRKWGWLSPFATNRGAAAIMRWGVVANILQVKPGRLAFVRSRFRLTRRSSHADVMGLMKRVPDLRAQLRATGIAMDVAVGEHDLWSLRRHAEFAEAIGATMNVYRTGHSPCEDAPYELCYDLLQLFARAADTRDEARGRQNEAGPGVAAG